MILPKKPVYFFIRIIEIIRMETKYFEKVGDILC
jgi:hypothetical protein